MAEEVEGDIEELPYEVFHETLQALKKKDGHKYDFILKGGDSLLSALYNLFRIIWRSEKIPESWMESTLTQIPKKANKVGHLDAMRHIHEKNDFFKCYGQIVMGYAKPILFQNMSKFQIASKP